MLTLREFLKIAKNEHYRIYQPNRDCLIFESYFKIHSPYKFGEHSYEYQSNYWDNNDYCREVYEKSYKNPAYDEETKTFLDFFGDMEVFSVESSAFKPAKMYVKNGQLCIDDVRDCSRPYQEYLPCFNIFVTSGRTHHCDDCFRSLRVGNKAVPDQKDGDCKKCKYYKNLNKKKGK